MRVATVIGSILILFGSIGIVLSIIYGSASIGLLLIVPIIVLHGAMPVLSLMMVISGLLIVALTTFHRVKPSGRVRGERTWGGVVFIGPFPILFGDMKGAIPLYIRIILLAVCVLIISLMLFIILAISL